MDNSNEGKIDNLKKKLYKPGQKFRYRRHSLEERSVSEQPRKSTWKHAVGGASEARPSFSRVVIYIFVFSLLFFAGAVSFAFWRFFISQEGWSSQNVLVQAEGPVQVAGGEEESFTVTITNSNPVAMEDTLLKIGFPDSARAPGDLNNDSPHMRYPLNTISPGEVKIISIPFVLFGEENTEASFDIVLEYRMQGSSGVLSKESFYQVSLGTSPVSVAIGLPSELSAGEEVVMHVRITSQLKEPLPDLLVRIDYPFGFSFEDAIPPPALGNNVWRLGTLRAAEEKEIVVRGKIEGVPGDQKAFRVFVGKEKERSGSIALMYNTALRTVPLESPSVALSVAVNGEKSRDAIVDAGSNVVVDIKWQNNFSSEIRNASLRVKLSGTSLPPSTKFKVDKGFYRSIDDVIIYNATTDPSLRVLEPGESGGGSFSFNLPSTGLAPESSLIVDVLFEGERVSSGVRGQLVNFNASRKIKVATDVVVNSYALYNGGPFQNSGPFPPRANQETTFTVVWSAASTINDIENARMSATIPSTYVRWMGVVSGNEKVTYNDATGEILWDIGSIKAGEGVPARQVAFQIGVIPSTSQIEESPIIVFPSHFRGQDSFTKKDVARSTDALSTNLHRDPIYSKTSGRVLP